MDICTPPSATAPAFIRSSYLNHPQPDAPELLDGDDAIEASVAALYASMPPLPMSVRISQGPSLSPDRRGIRLSERSLSDQEALNSWITAHPESVGINRRVVGNERVLRERRIANPSWPRVLRGTS